MGIWSWIVETLRSYPELAIFLALATGFWIGPKKLAGFSLGNVTATLPAAALGMIQETAKSKVPALGYGMPYAIGNTLLTIFGMVIVLMLAGGS